MSKKTLSLLLTLLILAVLCSCAWTYAAENGATGEDEASDTSEAEDTADIEPVEYAQDTVTLTAKTTTAVRKLLPVLESTEYMLSAKLVLKDTKASSKYGLCAVSSSSSHLMDLEILGSGAVSSYATLYGNEMRSDLGTVNVAAKAPEEDFDLAVIRDGDLYYYIINGKLYQIREFRSDKGVPGLFVSYGTVEFKNVEYTNDPARIRDAINGYLADFKGYGFGNDHANFEGIEFADATTFTYPESFQKSEIDSSRMAFEGSYKGKLEITFKTKDLVARSTLDNSGDDMCRLRFLLYYENGYTDMICLGVANKQDRIETFARYDIAQWFNHADLTDGSGYFNWAEENEIRILLNNTGYSTSYSVYVNGKLCAVRSTCSSGSVSFGFEAENVSGTVSDFKVAGGAEQ